MKEPTNIAKVLINTVLVILICSCGGHRQPAGNQPIAQPTTASQPAAKAQSKPKTAQPAKPKPMRLTDDNVVAELTRYGQTNPETRVRLTTPMGTMLIKLFENTPLHRANFVHLVKEHFYDGTEFYRVIDGFMIQGGDPNSLHAEKGAMLGEGEIGSPMEAEIRPNHIHKRGALAAARKPDKVNPEKKSSGSQFYIVQGKVLTAAELNEIENKRNTRLKNDIFYKIQPYYEDSLKYYQAEGRSEELMNLQLQIMTKVQEMAEDQGLFSISDDDRYIYMTEGGVPHLDGDYTVFGEVVEGLDVIDRIASVQTDIRNRPCTDIRMTVKIAD